MFCLGCQASKDLLKEVALLIKCQREDRALDFLCLFLCVFSICKERRLKKNPKAVFLIATQRNSFVLFELRV